MPAAPATQKRPTPTRLPPHPLPLPNVSRTLSSLTVPSAAPPPRPTLRARLRAFVRRIAAEHASPPRLFAACVVGGMVGSTPFFGLHFFLSVGVATLFRLNRVAVYGAANISIPPLAPFLATACVTVGSVLLRGRAAPFDPETLKSTSPWQLAADVFASWLLGAPIVGGLLGAAIGGVVVATVARRRGDPWTEARARTVARFEDAPPSIRHYVAWKIRLDPVYRAIVSGLPDRCELVELGCGLGILPILACELGAERRALGVDWDARKIGFAEQAARGLPVRVERGDVRAFEPPPCDMIAIVDVLHYFDDQTQRAILARAAAALRPGGALVVRDGDGGREGSAWTRAIERLAVRIGWNKSGARPRFRPIDDVVADLRASGLACEVVPTAGPLHPGNVLVRATRASC